MKALTQYLPAVQKLSSSIKTSKKNQEAFLISGNLQQQYIKWRDAWKPKVQQKSYRQTKSYEFKTYMEIFCLKSQHIKRWISHLWYCKHKECKKEIYSKSAPIQHQWLPTGKNPYHCKVHRKALSWKSPHLIVYQWICATEKPDGCKEHWKAFQCKPHLSEHGRTGTSKKPYHWGEHRKPFYRKPCLTQHKRTLDKLHECREGEKVLCGRSWHQRIHACIECVKAFHCKSDLS